MRSRFIDSGSRPPWKRSAFRPAVEQQPDDVHVRVHRGVVQRRASAGTAVIHVRACFDEERGGGRLAIHGRVAEERVVPGLRRVRVEPRGQRIAASRRPPDRRSTRCSRTRCPLLLILRELDAPSPRSPHSSVAVASRRSLLSNPRTRARRPGRYRSAALTCIHSL